MWAISNLTPYATERTWLRDKMGVHHWIVAVKATFDITPDGSLRLADKQQPLLRAPVYLGEPGKSSLRCELDLGAPKPTTDIIVNAQAYAPRERPVGTVPVSIRVGTVHKTLLVHGARVFCQDRTGIVPSAPRPFATRPIRYELAFGGMDTSDPDPQKHSHDRRNPLGCGFARNRKQLVRQPAPSIEYPNGTGAHTEPAGFGAIASYWSPRLEYAGTYDAHWQQKKRPLLPDDYNERFSLCAPADQQPAEPLRGGEAVELVNLTPSGRLRFWLPQICLGFQTRFGNTTHAHECRMANVIIEPDDLRLMVVWQTSLRVESPDVDYLDATLVREKACRR